MKFEFGIVSGKTVSEVIEADVLGCINVVRDAYRTHWAGDTINPNSYFLRYPQHAGRRIIALPAHLGGEHQVSGIKWIASFPENVANGFPRASATLILNNAENGYPFACLEASIISAARTAASAVLAATELRRSTRARSIGFVGNGLIAKYIYRFFMAAGWSFDEVQLYDIVAGEADRFASSVCDHDSHQRIVRAPDLPSLLRSSDVIVFATIAAKPYVTEMGLFSHNPVMLNVSLRDLSPEIILGSHNVVDDVGHVLNAQTSPHLAEQLVGHRQFIAGTLGDVLAGKLSLSPDRPTVFSPFGLGILDLAVGHWVYQRASALGSVTSIPEFFFEVRR